MSILPGFIKIAALVNIDVNGQYIVIEILLRGVPIFSVNLGIYTKSHHRSYNYAISVIL